MKKQLLSYAAIAAVVASAQAETVSLDTVEVTAANRTSQNIKDLTESVAIITSEDIKESRVNTLADALDRIGNIAMVNNGGIGKTTSFLLRGMDSGRTLVLIDGVRYNDIAGGAHFQHIRLDDVERIEIIKGAQSGIWGADASAGVVNIITKNAKKGTHATFGIEGGSFNTAQGSTQFSHKTDMFDVIAGISRLKTDGFSAAEPKQGSADYGKRGDELGYEKDAYINNAYSLKVGYNITGSDRIEVAHKRIDAYAEYDGGGGSDAQNEDPWGPYYEKTDNRFYSAAYDHKDEINELTLQYKYSYFNRKVSDYKGNVEEILLQDRIDYAVDSFFRMGGSYQRFEHENVNGLEGKEYDGKAVYITNYNKFSDITAFGSTVFTQSLRHDRYSTFDNKTTGKLGIKQFVYENDIYIASNYGTGYNIPTLAQLFGLWGPNANLQPETAKTFDLSIGNDHLTLTYFHNKITDMIEWTGVWPAAGYENISGTSILKGVELGYKDDFFELFDLSLNYTYLDAKNADGEFLRSRPKHQIDGNLFCYVTQELNIGLYGQYIGERYDNDDRQGAQTGRYTLFNTVVNYEIDKNFTLYGKIDNITDKYYQVRDGYATAERSYTIGLSAKY